jgi:hypothetical protein
MIPDKLAHLVDMAETDNFAIIETARGAGYRFFIVETIDEEMTALVLKLGAMYVWKR